MISLSQRPLPDNTQHSQQTNIHGPVGIRTHNLSRRAAKDLRLRPRGHWDRLVSILKAAICMLRRAGLLCSRRTPGGGTFTQNAGIFNQYTAHRPKRSPPIYQKQPWKLGKVIQMNQLDATMIYWSIRSVQHVSGNIFPIIRSVRLRFLQRMVSCCCGGQGDGERQRGTPCPPQQQDTICCKNLSLMLLMMGKILPETCWADLIDQ